MTLIDLTTQAQAPQSGGLILQSSETTSSLTGLHTLEFDSIDVTNLGTGSLNIGDSSTLTAGKVKINHSTDPVILDGYGGTQKEMERQLKLMREVVDICDYYYHLCTRFAL